LLIPDGEAPALWCRGFSYEFDIGNQWLFFMQFLLKAMQSGRFAKKFPSP
jgi:hypothetical protein